MIYLYIKHNRLNYFTETFFSTIFFHLQGNKNKQMYGETVNNYYTILKRIS